MFLKRRQEHIEKPDGQPVILKSICTGEASIGFKNEKTGRLEMAAAVKTQSDINEFCKRYNLSPENIKTIY